MKERHEAGLAELAEMGLSLARDLHACALAADDAATKSDLTLAFQRAARSVRQTFALEQRLERERRAATKEVAAEAAREQLARVQKKRRQLRDAATALIWTEYEGDEADDLTEAAEALVWEQSRDEETFLEAPLEACVARIRADLGLPAANDDPPDGGGRGRGAPDADRGASEFGVSALLPLREKVASAGGRMRGRAPPSTSPTT